MNLQTEYLKISIDVKEGATQSQLQAFRTMTEDAMAKKMIVSMMGSMAQGYIMREYLQQNRRIANTMEEDEIAQTEPLTFHDLEVGSKEDMKKHVNQKVEGARTCRMDTCPKDKQSGDKTQKMNLATTNNLIESPAQKLLKSQIKRQFEYCELFMLRLLNNSFQNANDKKTLKIIFNNNELSSKRLESFLTIVSHPKDPYYHFANKLCSKINDIASDPMLWQNFTTRNNMHQKTQHKISKTMSKFLEIIRKKK